MIAVADNDIADTDGDADPPGSFDLRAADLDGVAVTDIFLDRRRQPRRGHLKIDRTRAKPPPQPAKAYREDHHQDRDHNREAFYPTFCCKPSPQRSSVIAVKPGTWIGQQPARAMARRLVMVLIPTGIIPLRGLGVSARSRSLGRRIPCHCLSVRTLIVRLIAAKA